MKLSLQDIKHYSFESGCNRSIYPITIYYDGLNHITELSQKTYLRNTSWRLSPLSGESCVYFLLQDNEVVYIGQTIRPNRIKEHEKDKNFNSVWFIPTRIPYQIRLEEKLLSKYTTKYNKRYNKNNINTSINSIQKSKYYITDERVKEILSVLE